MDDRHSSKLLIHQLSVADAFNDLSPREKLYAHHLAKAAWFGTRIILRQVSPESNACFDLIIRLYQTCQDQFRGKWDALADAWKVPRGEVHAFVQYAATFLSNVGNYYVRLTAIKTEMQLNHHIPGFWGPKIPATDEDRVSAGHGKYFRAGKYDSCVCRGAHVFLSTQ